MRGWRALHITDGDHPYMKHWWVPGLQIGYEHTFIHQVADFLDGLAERQAGGADVPRGAGDRLRHRRRVAIGAIRALGDRARANADAERSRVGRAGIDGSRSAFPVRSWQSQGERTMYAMRRYEGTGVIVTGGASGIGLKTAERIVAEGGQVSLWDVDQGKLDAAKASLGDKARVTRLDITDPAAVERAAAEAERAMGRIDGLVCSAGVAGLNAMVVDYPIDEWKRVFDINVNGLFYCNRYVAPLHEGARLWPDRQCRLDRGQGGQSDRLRL